MKNVVVIAFAISVCSGKAAFAPVVVEEPPNHPPRLPPPDGLKTTSSSGRIEIILGRGRRIVVGSDVDAVALRRVLDALEPR